MIERLKINLGGRTLLNNDKAKGVLACGCLLPRGEKSRPYYAMPRLSGPIKRGLETRR